jgi:hypothetical protein
MLFCGYANAGKLFSLNVGFSQELLPEISYRSLSQENVVLRKEKARALHRQGLRKRLANRLSLGIGSQTRIGVLHYSNESEYGKYGFGLRQQVGSLALDAILNSHGFLVKTDSRGMFYNFGYQSVDQEDAEKGKEAYLFFSISSHW